MKRALVLWWIASLCSSCGLFHSTHSDEHDAGRRAADDAGSADVPAVDGGGMDAASAPAADGGQGMASSGEREEVWIGELWAPSAGIFCDPEHPDQGPSATHPEGYTWRVVLKLDVHDPNELGGELRFGETAPRLPLRPDVDPTAGNPGGPSFWACSFQLPVEGVGYRVLSGRSGSDGVDFDFAPNQIWEHWCATDKPVCPDEDGSPALCRHLPTCVCDEGECHADLRGRRRIQLSRTAETLEGHYGFGGGWGTPADIRLRRLR